MTFRDKLPFIFITVIILFCTTYLLSEKTPFNGDEFYTLDIDKIHKPIPYKFILAKYIERFEAISSTHIFHLRITSIFFTIIGIILCFITFAQRRNEAIILTLLLITNSFINAISIFFRYYSFYFFTSMLTFIFLTQWVKHFSTNKKLLFSFAGMIISPFVLYVLNTLQFVFYFFYMLLFEKIKRLRFRLACIIVISVMFIGITLNPWIIWYFLKFLNISDHGAINAASENIHGFTKSSFIKPIYAVYQMFFGHDVAPTFSVANSIFFIMISIFLLHQLFWIFIEDRELFLDYLFILVIPFLTIYLFFEVLSTPGFTQLETIHGMFLYPLLVVLIVKAPKYVSPLVSHIFIGVVLISQLIGMHSSYIKIFPDWNLVIGKVDNFINDENSNRILMDGRSMGTFDFYNQYPKINKMISYTCEPMDSLELWITDKERLILLLNDYKSYTPLTLRQNWNAGKGSLARVEKLKLILKRINKDYYLYDSYISYPTFLYLFKKKVDGTDNILSASVWQHHLKDLSLPIYTTLGEKIKSSILIPPGDTIYLGSHPKLVLNLEESNGSDFEGDTVGMIQFDNQKIPIIKGENIWDVFAEFNDETINNAKVFHSWYHTPLVSGSIKYEGSYFKHKAHIYTLALEKTLDSKIHVINTSEISSIRIWN